MPGSPADYELRTLHRSQESEKQHEAEEEEEEHAGAGAQRHSTLSLDTTEPTTMYNRPSHTVPSDDDLDDDAVACPSTSSTALNRRTVRKLDTLLLSFLAILFLLNSLDKSNIGNAETAGFTHDTGLSRSDINLSMAVFFFVFVLLQPVGAALGRRFGMRRYVPLCMSLWGLATVGHIWVRKRWHLVVLRTLIAMLESGFYPTAVSYLSLFYTKFEFAVRLGWFYGMTAVAGVLGGMLSWAVFSRFPGDGGGGSSGPQLPPSSTVEAMAVGSGWKSWEVLFLIEGCTTMTVALIGFVWLPRSADTAWFLNEEEKTWAEKRMRRDLGNTISETSKEAADDDDDDDDNDTHEYTTTRTSTEEQGLFRSYSSHSNPSSHSSARLLHSTSNNTLRPHISSQSITADAGLTRQEILAAIFNPQIWHLLLINILSAMPATAFGVLLPIVVSDLSPSLNLSPAASNLLSAPPFACGALVLFAFTIWSDRSRQRLVPILWGLVLLVIGLVIAVITPVSQYWLRYFALCVLLSGSFIASPLTVAWLANNTPEPGKRAILLGINGWGNLAGVFVSVLFTPQDRDAGYVRSFTVLLVCVLVAFAGFVLFRVLLVRENRFRERIVNGWTEDDKAREELIGDVLVPERASSRFARIIGLEKLKGWLGWEEERRGDAKMTFRYGL
ncbi:MFS transporter like protein [Zymoseptoria brevis]|uniref:MFS transporter like protein n=1 Tax=Zymoseptoria brevis TaxID=1047168 RepID=A0A0F4GGZ9_9PEZI|nr:MFS transporter like protein [Zymoseptoria brevis]